MQSHPVTQRAVKRLTSQQVLAALEHAGGIRSEAAKLLGCARETLSRYLTRHPELAQDLEAIEEASLDLAESKLLELIRKGDGSAIRFYLRCKGKGRGWVQGQELSVKPDPRATLASPNGPQDAREELQALDASALTK